MKKFRSKQIDMRVVQQESDPQANDCDLMANAYSPDHVDLQRVFTIIMTALKSLTELKRHQS